ncbi:MAG: aldo/keto reductase [Acidobacteriota bacterium]
MRTVRFGRTGAHVSAVSLGTWPHGGPSVVDDRPVGWFGTDDDEARKTLLIAHENGINHWDTADVYGNGHAELLIGNVWDDVPRDDVFLASKVGWDPGPYSHAYHPDQIRRQLERSLRNLKTDHLELYYFHHCDFGAKGEYLDDALAMLHRFRDQGKIRHIGLSDWDCEQIVRFADRVDPDVVQCYRNVVDDSYESSGLKSWVEAHDAGVAFFSPIKHGLLLGGFVGPVTFGVGDHRNTIPDFRDYGLITRLQTCRREMIERFDHHAEPVLHGLIGALLSDADTGCALLGARRADHAHAACKIGETLDEDDARFVRRLYAENGRPTRASWKMQ